MKRVGTGILTLGLLVMFVSMAAASTPPSGSPLQVPEVDNAAATVWAWITTIIIHIVALALGVTGCSKFAVDRVGARGPIAGIGGGAMVEVIPSIMGGVGRVAPAATVGMPGVMSSALRWVHGFTGQALVVDPVALWLVGSLFLLLVLLRGSQPRRAWR